MIIAIDGPAGSGKSTVAKLVALELGFSYLDTGAMYRAITVRAAQSGIEPGDAAGCTQIATHDLISFAYESGEALPTQVFIGGQDVTQAIRTPQTDANVSQVCAHPGVRTALTEQQRRCGLEHDTVMEGRDIGTFVFPDADLKVFLTADAEVRAARRFAQNAQRSLTQTSEAEILAEIIRRDQADSSRELAPLAAAADAVTLDTTNLTIDQVVAAIAELAKTVAGNTTFARN
jgi:cytidylate kinase